MARTYDPLSFTKAKAVVFRQLVTAVGRLTTIDGWVAKDGVNSFSGFLPPAFDVWGLTIGGGGDVRQTWNTVPPWELSMDWNIEGQFRDQAAADEVGMKLLSILDLRWIDDDGNKVTQSDPHRVQSFRLRDGGNLDVFLGEKPIANEGAKADDGSVRKVLLWELHLGGRIVFNTWTDA